VSQFPPRNAPNQPKSAGQWIFVFCRGAFLVDIFTFESKGWISRLERHDHFSESARRVLVMSIPTMDSASAQRSLVSVVIPAYEAAQHIANALESVFAQTYSHYEIIVINDGSPDTPQLLDALRPYQDRIRYLKQHNQGPSGARNSGVLAAAGQYIAFLDSDDCWFPSYLAEQVRLLEGPPPHDLVYCNAQRVGARAGHWPTCMDASPSNGPVDFESLLRERCTVITSFTVVRRQAVLDAGLFDRAFRRSEDFDLWLRMARQGASMTYQRTVLGTHELRFEGLSGDLDALREAQIAVYRKVLATAKLSEGESSLLRAQIDRCQALVKLDEGKHHLISGRYHEAAVAIGQANVFYRRVRLRVVSALLRVMPSAVRRMYLISLNLRLIWRQVRSYFRRLERQQTNISSSTSSAKPIARS
jgi:glycosyltransferase involved in cell wall biosynthesis